MVGSLRALQQSRIVGRQGGRETSPLPQEHRSGLQRLHFNRTSTNSNAAIAAVSHESGNPPMMPFLQSGHSSPFAAAGRLQWMGSCCCYAPECLNQKSGFRLAAGEAAVLTTSALLLIPELIMQMQSLSVDQMNRGPLLSTGQGSEILDHPLHTASRSGKQERQGCSARERLSLPKNE